VLTTNFSHLRGYDEQLFRLGALAERYFPEDPNTAMLKLRQLGEGLAQEVASRFGIEIRAEETQQQLLRRLECEKVHVAVDDATRLAYVEVLPDEQQSTTVGLLVRAVGWFSEQGMTCRRILSDNGSAYRSGALWKACRSMAIRPSRTKPYTPQANGKAERFIKTLLNEWAYAMPFQTSNERNSWLPRYVGLYNGRRSHMALCGLSPQQRLIQLLTAE
jgi:hypothetical protein